MKNRARPESNTHGIDTSTLRATASGTERYAHRFQNRFVSDFFRQTSFGLHVSSIGLGTYLGETTDADDAAYESAIRHAVESGINLLDTAINYRAQRSESAIGAAVQQLIAAGITTREQLVVCTKGGYIPLDRTPPATREAYQQYVKREFIDQEILRPDEIVAGGHSLAPRFLRYCLAKSRQNLGLRTIDVYYVHNPSQQLGSVSGAELRRRMEAAFGVLEEASARGEIGVYGIATWEGLRAAPGEKGHLDLQEMAEIAHGLAGDAHHFKAVEVPINLAMTEAVRTPTQLVNGKPVTVVEAANHFGLTTIASATLMQSRLASGLPEGIRAHFSALETDAQRAIAFVRTVPGVASALVGMKQAAHIDENLASVSL